MARPITLRHQDYTVGWICALPVELAASKAMLDDTHNTPSQRRGDNNKYTVGRIGQHNIVMTCLPMGGTGTTSASRVVAAMLETFRMLRFGLLVGIGGGAPSQKHDIRLGDIVVSTPNDRYGGIIQYDFGKTIQDDCFFITGSLDKPSNALLTAVSNLAADHLQKGSQLSRYLADMVEKNPSMGEIFSYPGRVHTDQLYESNYDHPLDALTCSNCDSKRLISRSPRNSCTPRVFRGLIASANQVMRYGDKREKLRKDFNILCFEMEAAGVMDALHPLVIRGICDYADSHKNKVWQPYAAATAAAYAKELLCTIQPEEVAQEIPLPTINQAVVPPRHAKPIFSVPFERDDAFVSREDVIHDIEELLKCKHRACISGLGGVGKSQIAIEYAYKFQEDNPHAHVFWVYAATVERFYHAYKDIAKEMQLPHHDDPNHDVCELVLDWLNGEKSGHWLLVIDNADDSNIFLPLTGSSLSSGNIARTRKPLLHYIPKKPSLNQSILITSRDSRLGWNLAHGVPPIYVLPFEAAQSKLLLARKAGKKQDSLDHSDATELLELLDHIPLAIAQAAAFMKQNNMSLKEYLEALTKDEQNLSQFLGDQCSDPRRELAVPSSVFRTWKLTFDQIQMQHPRAAKMLSLSAMFDRQQIPQQLVLRDQEDKRDFAFVQAIGILTGLSLITKEIGHQTFSMHRLVQLSILAWLEHSNQKAHYEREALFSLSKIRPAKISSLQSSRDWEKLYPHVQVVLQYRFERESTVRVWATLLFVMIDFERLLGRCDIAQEKSLQAYEKTRKVLGDDDLTTLESLLLVMQGLDIQGEYEEAEKMCQKIILGYKKTAGVNHECTLYCILSRARRLRDQMNFEAAEDLCTQLLVDVEKSFGIEHDLSLSTAAELSEALKCQGRVNAAEKLWRRIVGHLEKKLGPNDERTQIGVRGLAEILRDRGDEQAAVEMFRRALRGRMNLQGEAPYYTLSNMVSLADLLKKRGHYSEAGKLFRQILQKEKEWFKESSLPCLRANYGLAHNLYSQAKYWSASQFGQRALARCGEMYGPDDENTLLCSRLYASILERMREEAARGLSSARRHCLAFDDIFAKRLHSRLRMHEIRR